VDEDIEGEDKRILPVGRRDWAMFAVLADSGCRFGKLANFKVGDFRTNGEHGVLSITGKGNKARTTPRHPVAAERVAALAGAPRHRLRSCCPPFSVPRNRYAAVAGMDSAPG
jgi:integrase